MTRKQIEDAVKAWLGAATGLPPTNVVIADQNAPPPDGSYVSVRVGASISRGVDELHQTETVGAPAGEEVEFRLHSDRTVTVTVTAYSASTTDESGADVAVDVLEKARNKLGLPTIRDALNTAGLGVVEQGQVQNLSAVAGADFEGVASLDVRFSFRQTNTERTGYIATVEVTNTETGDEFVIVLP